MAKTFDFNAYYVYFGFAFYFGKAYTCIAANPG